MLFFLKDSQQIDISSPYGIQSYIDDVIIFESLTLQIQNQKLLNSSGLLTFAFYPCVFELIYGIFSSVSIIILYYVWIRTHNRKLHGQRLSPFLKILFGFYFISRFVGYLIIIVGLSLTLMKFVRTNGMIFYKLNNWCGILYFGIGKTCTSCSVVAMLFDSIAVLFFPTQKMKQMYAQRVGICFIVIVTLTQLGIMIYFIIFDQSKFKMYEVDNIAVIVTIDITLVEAVFLFIKLRTRSYVQQDLKFYHVTLLYCAICYDASLIVMAYCDNFDDLFRSFPHIYLNSFYSSWTFNIVQCVYEIVYDILFIYGAFPPEWLRRKCQDDGLEYLLPVEELTRDEGQTSV